MPGAIPQALALALLAKGELCILSVGLSSWDVLESQERHITAQAPSVTQQSHFAQTVLGMLFCSQCW